MSDDTRRDEQRDETPAVSCRKFLEHSATAGGVALVGVAAIVGCAAQDGNKTAASNSASTPTPGNERSSSSASDWDDLII